MAELSRRIVVPIPPDEQGQPPYRKRGQSYTDDELRMILSAAPTRDNAEYFAIVLQRKPGAIQQIYRWAAASDARIAKERPHNKFIRQIQRIRKEVGWLAVGWNTVD